MEIPFKKIENNYEGFDSSIYNKFFKKHAPKMWNRISSDFKNGKPFNYFFLGGVGVGKTYTTKVIQKLFIDNANIKFEFMNVRHYYRRNYLDLINSSYSDRYESIRSNELSITQAKYLIIDDLGNERPSTDAAHDYIGTLIIDRYEYYLKHPTTCTIITSNLTQDEMIRWYGSRIVDRMEEMCVIMKFNNKSFRRQQREIIEG